LKSARTEIEKLKRALAKAGGAITNGEEENEKIEEIKAQLEEMKAQMVKATSSVSPESILRAQVKARQEAEAKRKTLPHLEFLHPDPNFSRTTCSFLDKHSVHAGKDQEDGVRLTGFGVQQKHAIFTVAGDVVSVKALCDGGDLTIVNGTKLKAGQEVTIKPFDRIVMGKKNLFVFRHPKVEASSLTPEEIQTLIDEHDFDSAKDEMFKDELEAQMKAKQAEEAKKKAEFEKNLREKEAKMQAEREKVEEEKRRMEAEVAKIKATAGEERAKAEERMMKLEMEQKRMQEEMKKKEAEHKQWEINEKRRQENQTRQTEVMRMSITRLVPLITEANDMAAEFKIPVNYAMQTINSPDVNGDIHSKVFVQIINRITGRSLKYVVSEEAFNEEMFEMRELFEKYNEDPEAFVMPKVNPWIEGIYKPHYLGEARIWLLNLEYGFEIPAEDEAQYFKIRGWGQGSPVVGTLFMRLNPLISEDVMDKMLGNEKDLDEEVEPSLQRVPDLKHFDVEVSIDKIDNVPGDSSSNVFATFAVPPSINVATLDQKDVEEDDIDGVFETKICNQGITEPQSMVKVGYRETLRFKTISKEFFQWLKAPLTVKVYGSSPKNLVDIKVGIFAKEKVASQKAKSVDKKSIDSPDPTTPREDYESRIKEAMEKAAEDERRIKAKELEVQRLQIEVEELKERKSEGSPLSEEMESKMKSFEEKLKYMEERNRQLEQQLRAKNKELETGKLELEEARAATNEKSKAGCVLL